MNLVDIARGVRVKNTAELKATIVGWREDNFPQKILVVFDCLQETVTEIEIENLEVFQSNGFMH